MSIVSGNVMRVWFVKEGEHKSLFWVTLLLKHMHIPIRVIK